MNDLTQTQTSSRLNSLKHRLKTNNNVIGEEKKGSFVFSLNELPYFADHAFQGMIVLPGSAYIEMAIIIYEQVFNRLPKTIEKIKFENIILLSDADTKIDFTFELNSDEEMTISFVEASETENSANQSSSKTSLKLYGKTHLTDKKNNGIKISDLKLKSGSKISAKDFYQKLSQSGNQYGPHFQNISEIWLSENESLGKLHNTSDDVAIPGDHFLHPSLLDSFAQLLSTLNENNGRTFVLSSIDKIILHEISFPKEVWCRAGLINNGVEQKNEFTGDLIIFDEQGNTYLELKGVHFKYLEQLDSEREKKEIKQDITVVSTFTADLLEDSLKFWGEQFKTYYNINFAPYNQVFQELLNPESLFYKNKDGVNVILLGLEDWARLENQLKPLMDSQKVDEFFKNRAHYSLPNKIEIAHLNKYETDYVYKEIFEDKVYLKHGIKINDGDTIIDIGANIGLFTLFINQNCKDVNVYSFEPSPIVYDLLKTNSSIYCSHTKTFNCGVSDKKKTARFTFYNTSSVFSSFNANEEEDKEAIQAVVRNMLSDISSDDTGDLELYVEELTSGRLDSQTFDCPLISVADIIRDNSIKNIDLLKIDAEKSELDILKGIGESNWDKIKQIVIEIHDKVGDTFEEVKSILAKKGFKFEVEEEKFLKESGLYNIYAKKEFGIENSDSKNVSIRNKENKLKENIDNFINAFNTFLPKSKVPVIVGICERSPETKSDVTLNQMFDQMESQLVAELSDVSNANLFTSGTINQIYPVKEYFDKHGNELGHIPYTQEYFAALGTMIFRNIVSLKNNPYKVIVLDCDNTLWGGVCGEDGTMGIKISDSYRELQKFVKAQINTGMLVCLCSKNNEEDVFDVFEKREDMILKKEDLVSWKINWNFKSENLKSLANELNLGLNSFIFIDDNPVECGEVKINCPDVLTLQLPHDEKSIPKFLKNIWAFDHTKLTEEDKKRTRMYQENVKRERYRESSMSLNDFLDGLKLNIKISNPAVSQISRVSQLTFRTNQFNFTTIRKSEAEVQSFLSDNNNNCLVTEVTDRFGDYGLVGVLLYSIAKNKITVDTFLLSCRVLGRGVEHKILSELGGLAFKNKIEWIEIKYIPTAKNKPALSFIESFGMEFKSDVSDGLLFRFPTQFLADLKYEPSSSGSELIVDNEKSKKESNESGKNAVLSVNLSDTFQMIANDYISPSSVMNEIEKSRNAVMGQGISEVIQPHSDLEKQLAQIWQKVLGNSKFGLSDNFFEVGGSSLKAVQLIALVKKEIGANISVVTLFECPTISLLSKKLDNRNSDVETESKFDEQVERGTRRRQKRISRKRSEE
jgi:FkbH-like protein/FkbM family methyltransferase